MDAAISSTAQDGRDESRTEVEASRVRIAETVASGGSWRCILGVSAEASPEDVRRAFRELALLHHPDKNPEGAEDETFKHAQKAYEEGLAAVRPSAGIKCPGPPSGSLVTASFDYTVKLWAARTGQCRRTLKGHADHVHSAALAPDGRRLITGAMDRTLKIWDLQTGECEDTITQELRMLRPSFSPDGGHILTVALDDVARLWNLDRGELLQSFRGHKGQVHEACFAGRGELVVTVSTDKTVKVWKAATGKCLQTLEGHRRDVLTVAAAPSGEYVVTGSKDSTLKVWLLAGGTCSKTLEGHDDAVISSGVHPSSEYVASGSDDCSARVWNVLTGQCVWHWPSLGYVNSISFSPDGGRAATGTYDRVARIWNLETGKCERQLKGHSGVVSAVLFVP